MMPSLFDAVSHSQRVVDGERDALEEHLDDYLTGIALHLKKLQPTRELFPFSFIDVEHQFLLHARSSDSYSGAGTNDFIIKQLSFVQREAAMALSDFEKISRWIALKIPPLEPETGTGVQELVLESVRDMKNQMSQILAKLPEYHWRRAEAIAKFGVEVMKETIEEDCREEGGTQKKMLVQRKSQKELRENVNYVRFCVLFDVEWYLKLRLMVEEIRSAHFQVCDAITKNVKQIMDPKNRGVANDRSRGKAPHLY